MLLTKNSEEILDKDNGLNIEGNRGWFLAEKSKLEIYTGECFEFR